MNGRFEKGHIPWNNNLTKETDERVARIANNEKRKKKISIAVSGNKNPFFNHVHTEETKEKNRLVHLGKHYSPETEFQKGMIPWNKDIPCTKETKDKMSNSAKERLKDKRNHPCWKDGISFEPYTVEFNKQLKKLIRNRDNDTY